MARHEADREDLLAEGVNLPERGRVIRSDDARSWILGWRKESALSLFVDVDPVFQFNTSGQLRRLYLDGQKLAACNGELTRLQKVADTSGRLVFQAIPLSDAEQAGVVTRLSECITDLRDTLIAGKFSIETVGIEKPAFVHRALQWCDTASKFEIASGPGVTGDR